MKRCMAQTLEEFERSVERPLREAQHDPANASRRVAQILRECDDVKRAYRKRLQAFAADCADLMPSDVQINAFEPIIRRQH
jgi:hypothetical protein